ncbi:unnamed protein product [Effrenium voratum]|nr:unnamed protein product [Effrenium voratum]
MSCRSPAGLTVPGAMNIAQLREVQASSGAPAVKDPSSNSGPSGEQLESLNQERPARLPGEVSGEMSDLQLHKG